MKRSVFSLLVFLFSALLVFSIWNIVKISASYQEGEEVYSELMTYVSISEPVPVSTRPEENIPWKDSGNESAESSTEYTAFVNEDDTVWPVVDFAALQQINPDIVGWIYIEGTQINYPIVQGEDNDYYLSHLFDGTYNSAGCIFLDAACSDDFSSRHSIIYGHHMKNDTMFGELMGYKKQDYYDEHAVALFLTPTNRYKVAFFSGYVAKDPSDAWQLTFEDGEYEEWLDSIIQKSCIMSEISPELTNRIITLSTCTYEFENARFVLHGILLEQTDGA